MAALDNPVPVVLPDGRHITTFIQGDGDDLVILEAGGANAGASWGMVVEALAPLTSARIIFYNRAGYGSSSTAWNKRTLADLSQDLRDLIGTLQFRRLVLVGHSLGGLIIRSVAASLGSRVTGLVLVDSTDELSPAYFGEMESAFYRNSWTFLPKAIWGSLAAEKAQQLRGLPEPYRSSAVAAASSVNAGWHAGYEVANIVAGLRELLATPAELDPSTAVTVISAQLPPGAPFRMQLNEAHRARAQKAGGRGKYMPATKSGHAIYQSEPSLVAQEIAGLLHRDA